MLCFKSLSEKQAVQSCDTKDFAANMFIKYAKAVLAFKVSIASLSTDAQ